MAMGWSGSNSGIGACRKRISLMDIEHDWLLEGHKAPLEISYFVNNVCNLKCQHCYVAYDDVEDALSIGEWEKVFDDLISLGARTFGNVGREPLLNWDKTRDLLAYFKKKRQITPGLRFGLVTNGTLCDVAIIEQLTQIRPDYLDISLDGTKSVHDYIRGQGAFDKTVGAIKRICKHELIEHVFISFTANRLNLTTVGDIVPMLNNLGIRRFLISPYASLNQTDDLSVSDAKMIEWVQELLGGRIIDFGRYEDLALYLKSDYSTQYELMKELVARGVIDLDNLFVDEYGVIFSKYTFGDNVVYFNYLPRDDYLMRSVRISHNGYVSNCLDMFFEDYPQRSIGNVRTKPVNKILNDALSAMMANP
jgi:sulfatase maturation enzyme AslB (radical SAM superfamily)